MAAQGVDHEQVMSQSSELRDRKKWSQAAIILIINDPPTEPLHLSLSPYPKKRLVQFPCAVTL